MATNPVLSFLDTAGNDITSGYEQLAKILTQQAKQAPTRQKENGGVLPFLQNTVNTVGKAVGSQPIVSNPLSIPGVIPNAPTTSQVVNAISPQSPLNPILSGKATGQQQLTAGLGLINPEEDAEASAGQQVNDESIYGKPGAVKVYTDPAINGADIEANAQKAVDNIPGVTANQKYQNLGDRKLPNGQIVKGRMSTLQDQIDAEIDADPKQVPSATLRSNYMDSINHLIAPEGTTPIEAEKQGLVTQDQANMYADNFIRQAQLKAGVEPSIDPSTATTSYNLGDIFKMKQQENGMVSPLLTKRANGGNLTPNEQLRIAGRDAYDKTITDTKPSLKNLTLEQSGLYNGLDSLNKARIKEDNAPAKGNAFTNFVKGHKLLTTVAGASVPTIGGALIGAGSYLSGSGGNPPSIKFQGSNYNDNGKGQITLPDPNTISSTPTPSKIPNDSNIYVHGVMPYQVNQAQQQAASAQQALQANPYNPTLKLNAKNAQHNYDRLNGLMNVDLANYQKTHPTNDTMVDNKKADGQNIEKVVNLLGSGALPKDQLGALTNQITSESAAQAHNSKYAELVSRVQQLENNGVILQGTIARGMTENEAKTKLVGALQTYYTKLALYEKNYRLTPDYTSPGANLIHSQVNAINTGSPKLDSIITPTPQPDQPNPTPNLFQRLSNASAQGQLLSQ